MVGRDLSAAVEFVFGFMFAQILTVQPPPPFVDGMSLSTTQFNAR